MYVFDCCVFSRLSKGPPARGSPAGGIGSTGIAAKDKQRWTRAGQDTLGCCQWDAAGMLGGILIGIGHQCDSFVSDYLLKSSRVTTTLTK